MGIAHTLIRQGEMDTAILINLKAMELAKKEKNELWVGKLAANIGNAYLTKQWYEMALTYYMEALAIFDKRDDNEKLAVVYYQLSCLYSDINAVKKAIEFSEKALEICPDDPYSLFGLANVYSSDQQYKKSNDYLTEALKFCKLQNNVYLMGVIYYHLGENALITSDLANAQKYAELALEINGEIGNPAAYGGALSVLSKVEELKGNFAKSEIYINEVLQIVDELDNLHGKSFCYMILSELAIAQRKYSDNIEYWKKWELVNNQIAAETTLRTAGEMEAKYENEKKELKISILEQEKRLMKKLSIAVGAALLLVLASFFFLWRLTVQSKKFAEAHIKQLEQEKQLVATQAVLDGETRERARLARDLHDGLGGLLTGVRLNLQEMKDGVKLEYVDVERFDKALGLLDESVKEMRRVSHHLMPDSLSRFGLKAAVSDFCHSLSQNITFNYYGEEVRLDPQLEVMIYRAIHELVNNALKHAGADQIMVQILQEPDRIAFTVEDNGCGFNPNAPTQGTGLQNIKNRIEAYNGTLHIDSKLGEGTEVSGELRVESGELRVES